MTGFEAAFIEGLGRIFASTLVTKGFDFGLKMGGNFLDGAGNITQEGWRFFRPR